ncbi:MAG TPA: hypothetical protein VF526_04915 [Solirubrobacteraceae bacterium]|jgi:predicted Zn-dependent protease
MTTDNSTLGSVVDTTSKKIRKLDERAQKLARRARKAWKKARKANKKQSLARGQKEHVKPKVALWSRAEAARRAEGRALVAGVPALSLLERLTRNTPSRAA